MGGQNLRGQISKVMHNGNGETVSAVVSFQALHNVGLALQHAMEALDIVVPPAALVAHAGPVQDLRTDLAYSLCVFGG